MRFSARASSRYRTSSTVRHVTPASTHLSYVRDIPEISFGAILFVAFAYLVLYNLMFILPLVVLTALAYFGVGSQRLGKFFTQNLVLAKILMGVLFVGLGILLVVKI